jgi:hypothetical protein
MLQIIEDGGTGSGTQKPADIREACVILMKKSVTYTSFRSESLKLKKRII